MCLIKKPLMGLLVRQYALLKQELRYFLFVLRVSA
jgi:hypothetical protein